MVANIVGFANVVMFHHHGGKPDSEAGGVGGCSTMWSCFIIMVGNQMVKLGGGQMPTPPHYSTLCVGPQASARTFMCTTVPVGFNFTHHGS